MLTNSLFPLFPKNTPKPLTADMHPAVLQSRGQTGMYTQTQAKGIAGHQKIHTHTRVHAHTCNRSPLSEPPSLFRLFTPLSGLQGEGKPMK